jgi:hypothetical protein
MENSQENDQIPDIPLPSPTGEPQQLVPRQEFEAHQKDFFFQKKILNWTFGLVVGVVIVCFISFITFMIDAWRFHSTTVQEYNKTVMELKNTNIDLKLELLKEQLKKEQKIEPQPKDVAQ